MLPVEIPAESLMMQRLPLFFSPILLLAFLGSGCSSTGWQGTIKEGVVGSVDADYGSFAMETVRVLGAERTQLHERELLHLRQYLSDQAPQIQALRQLLDQILELRQAVVFYSLEMARINDEAVEPTVRSLQLSTIVDEIFRTRAVEEMGMSSQEFHDLVQNIAIQKDALASIRAVNPLIALLAKQNEGFLRELEGKALPAAAELIDGAIEDAFFPYRKREEAMEVRRQLILVGLEYLGELRAGRAAPKSEELEEIFWGQGEIPLATSGLGQLRKAENYLVDELRRDAEIRELLSSRRVAYVAAHDEFEKEIGRIRGGSQVARMQLAAWQRAHEALGRGVENPGKWLKIAFVAAGAAL